MRGEARQACHPSPSSRERQAGHSLLQLLPSQHSLLYSYSVLRTNANFVARAIYVLRIISISYKAILATFDIMTYGLYKL